MEEEKWIGIRKDEVIGVSKESFSEGEGEESIKVEKQKRKQK